VTPSGTRDPAFDLTTPFGVERQASVAPLPRGKLLAGWGMTDGSTWVSRHHPNGERDESFTEGSYSVEVQADYRGGTFTVVASETSGDLLLYGTGPRPHPSPALFHGGRDPAAQGDRDDPQ
jgi:hypothetical protein